MAVDEQRRASIDLWERFAADRGLTLTTPASTLVIEGEVAGLAVRIQQTIEEKREVDEHRRVSRELSFRCDFAVKPAVATGDLSLTPEGAGDKVAIFFGGEDHKTKDSAFDPVYRIRSSAPAELLKLLTDGCRSAMLDARKEGVVVTLEGGFLRTTAGQITDPAVAGRLLDTLLKIGRVIGT